MEIVTIIVLGVGASVYWVLARKLLKTALIERAFREKPQNRKLIGMARWLLWLW